MLRKASSAIFFYAESILTRSRNLYPIFKYLSDRLVGGSRNVEVFLIKGQVGGIDAFVKTLFIGTRESAYEFADRIYSHFGDLSSLKVLRQNQVAPLLLPNAEIIAARIDRPFAGRFLKQNYLVLPNVSFRLDLRMSTATLIRRMSRRRRRDIQKIRRFNYSYSISSHDERDFNFFYREMYLPYAVERFGKTAHVRTYLDLKAIYRGNGGILFLKREEMPIAGILFQLRGKEVHASSFGVYQGDESYVRDLASQATLFFLIKWAKARGMETLDYGVSAPFFKDGIFTYKKEWGMAVDEQRSQSVCAMKLNFLSQGSLSFLQHNPFITIENNRLKGIVFLDHKPADEELKQVFSRYFLPKLDSLIVIAFFKSREVEGQNELSAEFLGFKLMEPLLSIYEALRRSNFIVVASELKEKP